MFDAATFQTTPHHLKAAYIPKLRELFAKQAALPPAVFDLEDEELERNTDYRAYMDDAAKVIGDFYQDGGSRDQWNNLFWAVKQDVPELKPDFAP